MYTRESRREALLGGNSLIVLSCIDVHTSIKFHSIPVVWVLSDLQCRRTMSAAQETHRHQGLMMH